MKTKLPTTPGPYWWREKDGDKWEQVEVLDLFAYKVNDVTEYTIEELGGQWAKAHTPDEGIEMIGVIDPLGRVVMASPSTGKCQMECEYMNTNDYTLEGNQYYTCEPVTIYRRDKE